MTQLAAIAYSYLKGESNSIMTAFQKFNCTNLPRENGRSIERKFGVQLHHVPVRFKSTYGHSGEYYRYTLIKTKDNLPGIKRMATYISKSIGHPKTTIEANILSSLKPLLK